MQLGDTQAQHMFVFNMSKQQLWPLMQFGGQRAKLGSRSLLAAQVLQT
jgi:hypothetical protein